MLIYLIGSNAGILSSLLYFFVTVGRRSPSSGGPWVVYAVVAIQCFVGYFMMWASVVGLIPLLPVPAMCLFMWMAAHAQTFFSTANVVTGVHNFGDYGGTIIGIMKLQLWIKTLDTWKKRRRVAAAGGGLVTSADGILVGSYETRWVLFFVQLGFCKTLRTTQCWFLPGYIQSGWGNNQKNSSVEM